ncbi:LPXTG cell wall anchor domain-containing protein, partial [Streptococcus suis]
RIAAGEVENTFVNIVNGKEMTAKVTTHTPEPPQPTPPAPNTPAKPANMLPSTGEASSVLSVLGGMILSGLGLAGVRKRKED